VERYQLFVADACAGMKTLLSLEAMGLLYLHVIQHDSWRRNILLGVLIVPISLFANILRVTVLALITYHFGEAAGRGFMHFYAGILLFIIALSFIMLIDHLIQKKLTHTMVSNNHG
jgi:exosortase/archaeosortase family protein